MQQEDAGRAGEELVGEFARPARKPGHGRTGIALPEGGLGARWTHRGEFAAGSPRSASLNAIDVGSRCGSDLGKRREGLGCRARAPWSTAATLARFGRDHAV